MAQQDVNIGKKRKSDQNKDLIISDEDLQRRLLGGKNINTINCEKKADKAFRQFLESNGCTNSDYWYFEEPELDNYLAKFWLCICKDDHSDSEDSGPEDPEKRDQKYSANTLQNFQYALNRILRTKGHLYNITEKGTSFIKSNEAFKVAIKDLNKEGKAEVKSYPEITEDGKWI